MLGTIVKGISGFYYVLCEDGCIYECKARGVFKKRGQTPLAGDKVDISVLPTGEGWIERILPRSNSFDRPPVANVEMIVLVSAVTNPQPNFGVLDRFCVSAELMGARILLCVNKSDLAIAEQLRAFSDRYDGIYPLYFVSAKTGEGLNALKAAMTGHQVAFAGPSGVGKSSLTNALFGSRKSETGEISERLLRGKNTTRHSELFFGDGFAVFDTPGFTSFDVPGIELNELDRFFPEFRPYIGECRFSDCRHLAEPECAVITAVEGGRINRYRYESYKDICKEIIDRKKY